MRDVVQCVLRGGLRAALVLMWIGGSVAGQECQLTVREDMYFPPATEMAGERSYPEVLILENEELSVWAVPNRGRLVYDLVRRETGNSQLVARSSPLPLHIRGVYTFEFGGVYSTFPWHSRDHQPLLLEWEVLEAGDACAVRMRSKDPGTDITFLAELWLPPAGSEVRLSLRLVNPRAVDQTVDFGLVLAVRPGGAATEDMELVLPVSSVTVGESEAQWMGEEGVEVAWPAPWSKWGNFEAHGWFYAEVESFYEPAVSVYNPQTDEYLQISWEPADPWTTCALFSWGPAYKWTMGAYDGFRIELRADGLRVPGEGEQVLELRLLAAGNRPSDGIPEH